MFLASPITFPNLGITVDPNPVAFTVFGKDIYWYGIIIALGFLLAFALTALMDSMFRARLPHDHGRAFAVNGELSKGKARGSGLIFVLCMALVTLFCLFLCAIYNTVRDAKDRFGSTLAAGIFFYFF